MKRFFFLAITTVVITGMFSASCNDSSNKDAVNTGAEKKQIKNNSDTDTLPDEPQFIISFDNKEYSVAADKVSAYIGSDSVITMFAKTGDTSGLHVAVPVRSRPPFSVPTGYSSANTKIAFSEEQAVLPTVILSNYPEVDVSFNNLNDSYHQKEVRPGAVTITGYRKIEGDDMHGWTWQLKGHIHTTVLKNVYSGKDKPYNHDYEVTGKFVVRFKTY